ncbi:hypothetical protein GVAV_002172 [Gurleya vavrai]
MVKDEKSKRFTDEIVKKTDFEKAKNMLANSLTPDHILNTRYTHQNYYAQQQHILKTEKDKDEEKKL